MHGRAEIRAATAGTGEEIRRITRRYIAEGEVEEYVAKWPDLRTIVCIYPATIRAWARGC
jgi:hypothetical protein